jgi:hypothetical protein
MVTYLFCQKNICAALAVVMAVTIVWKAKVESKTLKNIAAKEYFLKDEVASFSGFNHYCTQKMKPEDSPFMVVLQAH